MSTCCSDHIWFLLPLISLISSITAHPTFVTVSTTCCCSPLSREGTIERQAVLYHTGFCVGEQEPWLKTAGRFWLQQLVITVYIVYTCNYFFYGHVRIRESKADRETRTTLEWEFNYWPLLFSYHGEKHSLGKQRVYILTHGCLCVTGPCGQRGSEANWNFKIEEKLALRKDSFRQLCQYRPMLNTSTVWEEPWRRAHYDQWPSCVTLGWGVHSLFTFGFTLHRTSSKHIQKQPLENLTYFGFIIIPLIITASCISTKCYTLSVVTTFYSHFNEKLPKKHGTGHKHNTSPLLTLGTFDHFHVSGKIPILTCWWLLNDLEKLYRRSLPWQLPWTADGLCKAVQLLNWKCHQSAVIQSCGWSALRLHHKRNLPSTLGSGQRSSLFCFNHTKQNVWMCEILLRQPGLDWEPLLLCICKALQDTVCDNGLCKLTWNMTWHSHLPN